MSSNFLRMPLVVYYTQSWTFSEVFGVTSYVRQMFYDLFKIQIQERFQSLPEGHEAEIVDLRPEKWEEAESALHPGKGPPLRVYFIEGILRHISPQEAMKEKETYEAGTSFKGFNVALLDRQVLVDKFGPKNAREFSLTMGHELGHLLNIHHRDKTHPQDKPAFNPPNLMCSIASHRQRPSWVVNQQQVEEVQGYGFKYRFLM